MRVLQLAPWVTFGGADRGTIDWLRTLRDRGVRPYLLTTQPSDNALFGEAERWAEEAWCLPELMPGEAMPGFIEWFVASRRIDIVQVMNSKLGFDLLPHLRSRFPHLRTVAQLHAEEEDRAGYPSYVATRLDGAVDAYSLVSRELADRMVEYGVEAAKAHVIHLGVDTGVFDPEQTVPAPIAATPGYKVLFPHRLAEQKDPLLMVEVAAGLRDRGSGAVVHVVGDGEFRPAVEQAIERAGLGGRVVLHGARRDMPEWYAATDVTLLTSRFEGVPLVAYEAMAMGRPVVSGDVGAVAELVDDRTGFLVRPRQSVAGYVDALLSLEADAGLGAKLGEEGRRRVRSRFTVELMAEAHDRLYAGLLDGSTAPEETPPAGDPPEEGPWSLLWWGEDTTPQRDPAFLQKAATVAAHSPDPVFIGLTSGPGSSWRPVDAAPEAALLGVVVARELLPRVAGERPALWRSFPVDAAGGTRTVPRGTGGFLRRRTPPPAQPLARCGGSPAGGPAWQPPETDPLWLIRQEDDGGGVALLVGDGPAPAGFRRARLLGRVFTRPFWRSLPVVPDGPGLQPGGDGDPVAHVMTSGLPGMTELHAAVHDALVDLGVPGPSPSLVRGEAPVWIDLPVLPPPSVRAAG